MDLINKLKNKTKKSKSKPRKQLAHQCMFLDSRDAAKAFPDSRGNEKPWR
ncbi:hypothetical protein CES85_1263 [Ochrobactrum quorumnocens]|uniref:Uncharacterized protein n=1 Tax=Ochrobactrum quorumnocens TaxID=271865 RepID=A0A248UHT6_9HYPH|nr:hypothetical protein CES85_1263 [[Ochrobactrum] quorumnocens]